VGIIDGNFITNPTFAQIEKSDLDYAWLALKMRF